MSREEIQRRFALSGWDLDGGFSDYLVIGYSDEELSILAHKEVCQEDDDPLFVILDHNNIVSRWVHGVPTPMQARKLLHENDNSAEEREDLH